MEDTNLLGHKDKKTERKEATKKSIELISNMEANFMNKDDSKD